MLDWVILIVTFIIVVLVLGIVVISLLISIRWKKQVSIDTDVNEED